MENLANQLNQIEKNSECIILIHGLARTSRCMNKAAKMFSIHGYKIINVNYPSRTASIENLVKEYLSPIIEACKTKDYLQIHFLTHSMGGVLLRYYLANHSIKNLGKTVMLAPPNQGSEVADKLCHLSLYKLINGPAGQQLRTDANNLPLKLGKLHFETGIITGNKSINFFLSLLIPGENDGKVAVKRAKIEGMRDFLILPYTHSFIMQRNQTLYQALYFIQKGEFYR